MSLLVLAVAQLRIRKMNILTSMNSSLEETGRFIVVIAFVYSLLNYWRTRSLNQQSENWRIRTDEIGTYNDINSRYSDYLSTLLSYSDVNVGEFTAPEPSENERETYVRNLIYAKLVSLFERAHLLYDAIEAEEKRRREVKEKPLVRWLGYVDRIAFGDIPPYETHFFTTQWPGWVEYIDWYCSHAEFQNYWKQQYDGVSRQGKLSWQDSTFERFMNERIEMQRV